MYEVELKIKPGKYEYKLLMDHEWLIDHGKEINENKNNILSFEESKRMSYENLMHPRFIFNKYQQKLGEKYPEVYLEKKVYYYKIN